MTTNVIIRDVFEGSVEELIDWLSVNGWLAEEISDGDFV